MTRHAMKLPDVGEGVVEAEIVTWLVKSGDQVAQEQPIVELMTDKATLEIGAPVSGTVLETRGEPGERVAVGAELAIFETDMKGAVRASVSPSRRQVVAASDSERPASDEPKAASPHDKGEKHADDIPRPNLKHPEPGQPRSKSARRPAAPTVRRRAREAHIDLSKVPATGTGGRITQRDLDAYIDGMSRAEQSTPDSSRPPSVDTLVPDSEVIEDEFEELKLTGVRGMIAEKLAQSARSIPHFTYVEEVDLTDLHVLRENLNTNRRHDQPRLSYLPFLIKAVVSAVRDFPQCNARFDPESGVIRRYRSVHLGIATQTDAGLMVPVLRNAQSRDLWHLAEEIQRLSDSARQGRADPKALRGSTITVTSLGALGGIVSTPIINFPEVCILGVNKAVQRPVWVNDRAVPRLIMNLSSSFDHRIVDGYDAARFIQAIRRLLEAPTMLIG